VTTSHSSADIAFLDQLTAGAFTAPTSGDRVARLREWLASAPALEPLQEVYREMSARDKGAAKVLKERLDELKRNREQEELVAQWALKAEQLLSGARLNIADALAWQRDAAKAGAPLSREPLTGLKNRLADVVRRVEDLQHQVMVQREAAVLLAQRVEVLSTKTLQEAHAAREALQTDVQAWVAQATQLIQDSAWPSVDLKFPPQLEASRSQLQAVWEGFDAALKQADAALQQADAPLPSVPVWADEIRVLRGQAPAAAAATAEPAPVRSAKPKMDPAERQALREQATQAVLQELEALEKEVAEGHGKASAGAATALRNALKTHGRHLDPALDARVHQALTAAGELEGWQRWRADQLRQELLTKAEALLGADKTPAMGGRKMQEALRQLREAWKQTDQGGLPNHALWKKFDAACTEAYKTVQAWLDQLKQETAAQKGQRLQLIEEVKGWTAAQAESQDWRAQVRDIHRFSERWRNAGHLSEKAYAELQPQWKAAIHAAASRLEAAQKASTQRRHALIDEARVLGASTVLRIDAVKALQQRWQQEAQAVPLDRKTEQKLWEVFRQPIDEAFQRKGQVREQVQAQLSARDKAVLDASRALDEANASGDASRIRAAMAALDEALKAQSQASEAPAGADAAAADAREPAQAPEASAETAEAAEEAPAPETPKPVRPVVAVRGDDRPGQKKTEPAAARPARRDGRPGERPDRGERGGRFERRDERREERGPRLGDTAFRAQREARERAEQALRKLAAQAHGETLTHLLAAWKDRQPDALPAAQALGKGVNAATRQAWSQALAQSAQASADQSLLRLEMAAEVPTPAEHLADRRALQLQLLTRRHEASPAQTWGQDVAQVLASAHDEASARRLQNALRQLLRG
jgi:ATP-dependent RNA helicase SUPV3L1/SUV3